VRTFNPTPRCHIDAGRITQDFAVGDKVMATVNNYETGVTNGMHGVIESIVDNGAYSTPRGIYGWPEEVAMRMAQTREEFDANQLMEDVNNLLVSQVEDSDDSKERNGGPASHVVTIRFGDPLSASSFSVPFGSKSEVASLMFAYAMTCHKLQGSEADTVWTIIHPANPRLLTREWLYTACTRASRRQIFLYTARGEAIALSKQVIKGHTLDQKITNFARKPEILATFPKPREYTEYR
jgi:ATP-dependent exoDNAse (exonuclease V) alpha subunit